MVFCARCGGWASRRPKKLQARCARPTPPGRQALTRIAKGLAPWHRRRGKEHNVDRGDSYVADAYRGATGTWVTSDGRGIKRKEPAEETHAAAQISEEGAEAMEQDNLSGAGPPEEYHEQYDEDEEAAKHMGNDKGLDEGEDGVTQATVTDSSMNDRGMTCEPEAPATTMDKGHKRQAEADVEDATGKAAWRRDSRRKCKEAAEQVDRDTTKRALEVLCKGLKRGPRDGAERLEALRERVKKRLKQDTSTSHPKRAAEEQANPGKEDKRANVDKVNLDVGASQVRDTTATDDCAAVTRKRVDEGREQARAQGPAVKIPRRHSGAPADSSTSASARGLVRGVCSLEAEEESNRKRRWLGRSCSDEYGRPHPDASSSSGMPRRDKAASVTPKAVPSEGKGSEQGVKGKNSHLARNGNGKGAKATVGKEGDGSKLVAAHRKQAKGVG